MNKLKVKIIAMLCAVSLALGCVGTAVFAWFLDKLTTQVNFTATAHRSYFESGEGTEESPFEIAHPRQLYYLSWLQELGYFNQPDTEDNTKIKQFHFFLSKDLDMTGFTLPPIGTPVNPFVGTFDGKGYKISNLTVTNEDSAHTDTPSGDLEDEIQIIGVFGVIGSIGEAGTLTVNGNDYTYDTAKNSVKNFLIDSATLITKTPKDDKTLIGIAAGYVNGDIESVGVYDCSIKVASGLSVLDEENITDKISGYSLVGFSKAAYDAYVEKEGAEGNGWGGSVGMQKVHERLAAAYGTSGYQTNRVNYTYRKYQNTFYNYDGEQVGNPVQTNSNTAYYKYKNYNSTGGSTLLAMRGSTSISEQYFYINGGVRIINTKYYYKDTTGYSISDSTGSYHLVGNTSGQISQSTTEGTVWLYDNGRFYLENVGNQSTTATNYYLGVDNYGRLTCTQTSATWTASGNNVYSGDNYIVHVNGANGGWAASDSGKIIKITDGTDYLGYSSLNAVNSASAAEWLVSNGYIHTVINGTHYYLNRNNTTLSITNTPSTTWDVSSDGTIVSSGGYILICEDGVWKLSQESVYITDGNGHYLTGNGSIGNSNAQSDASRWILTPYGNNYYVSTTYNNNTYYLRNNSGTLALTTNTNQRTAWTVSDGILKSGDYQITYDNGWKLGNQYYYLYNGTYYINQSNSYNVAAGTNQNSATKWIKNTNGSFSPSTNTSYTLSWYSTRTPVQSYDDGNADYTLDENGYLVATYNGNTYRIRYSSSGWTATTNTTTNASKFQLIGNITDTSFISTDHLANENVSYGGTKRNSGSTKYYTNETEDEYLDYSQGYNTYIPLIVDSDDSTVAKKSNTGYIVGGSQDTTTSMTYPYGSGDIRVSYYAISGNISNSYSNGQLNESRIYTINASGRQSISQIGASNLQRYTSASAEFLTNLKKDNTNVYGLHFMSADISIDNLVTAAHVQVNGDTYENYEMPASSIDFNLKEKGYINFFAGTYFPNNNSFFSLHRIFRDENHKITAIKEISEIYGTDDENLLYIYKYEDGTMTYSDGAAVTSMPQGYELMFKTAWIKKQTSGWQDKYIYYFEIPADSGEYALGSVSGGTGAYLMHLDISANAGDVDRSVMDYLTGVDFVTASDTSLLAAIADKNPTAAFGLKNLLPGNIGTVKVKREEDGDIITFKIICSDTSLNESQLKEYIRYYYITPENKTVKIEWVIN